MTAVPTGMLLFGGARCTPGCTCLGDAFHLAISPYAIVTTDTAASMPQAAPGSSAGMEWRPVPDSAAPRAADAAAVKAAMLPAATAPAPRDGSKVAPISDGASGAARAVSPPWQAAFHWIAHATRQYTTAGSRLRGRTGGMRPVAAPAALPLPWSDTSAQPTGPPAAPPPRYRHTLSSEHRPHVAAVRMRAQTVAALLQEGTVAMSAGVLRVAPAAAAVAWTLLEAPYPLPTYAVLFGGESYAPSTYYDDVWVFSDAPTRAVVALLADQAGDTADDAAAAGGRYPRAGAGQAGGELAAASSARGVALLAMAAIAGLCGIARCPCCTRRNGCRRAGPRASSRLAAGAHR
jgi:hypothetical protein